MLTPIAESLWWPAAGCTMLHFLWVGGAIGLFALGGRRILRRAPLSANYAFTMCCLLALVAAPGVLFIHVAGRMRDRQGAGAEIAIAALEDDEDFDLLEEEAVLLTGGTEVETRPAPAPPEADRSDDGQGRLTSCVTALSSILPWAWIAGAAAFLGTLVLGVAGAHRMRRHTRLLRAGPPARMARRLATDLGLPNVAVGASDRIVSPTVVGVLRPIILLPEAALTHWRADQLRMVLLHELWHVRRRDSLVNFVQRLIESVLFFHPAVWWISGWVRADREYCCDSAVLRQTGQPLAYAETLAALAGGDRARARLAVAMGEHNLVPRIRRVLNRDRYSGKVLPTAAAMMVLVAGTCSLAWASRLRPGLITVPVLRASPAEQEFTSGTADTQASATHSEPDDQRLLANAREAGVTIRLVDEAGEPVAGAQVGVRVKWAHIRRAFSAGTPSALATSDQDGFFRIQSKKLLKLARCDPTVPCFAFDAQRRLAGTLSLTPEDQGRERVIVMQPVSRVRFVLDSEEVRSAGRSLTWSKGFVRLPGNKLWHLLRDTREALHTFEYFLPSGDYELVAFGGSGDTRATSIIGVCFEVPAGPAEVDLGVIQLPRRQPTAPGDRRTSKPVPWWGAVKSDSPPRAEPTAE